MQLVDQYRIEEVDQPRDVLANKPLWFWPLMDGEEDFLTVGAVRAAGRWELHAWQDFGDWVPMDRGPPGWWVAGYRDLRPVVYDFDLSSGAIVMPDTRLDPDHPVVNMAGIPIW